MKKPRERMTAADTREALIHAVMALMDQRSVPDISIKEIARWAGVNHGLVHRYFGSKEALVRAAVQRAAAMVNDANTEHSTTWSAGLLRQHPELARIVARVCLDGPRDLLDLAAPPEELLERFVSPARAAIARVGLEGVIDPYVANAAGVSALLGWIVFRPLFRTRYRLPADADDQFHALAAMVDAALAGHLTLPGSATSTRKRPSAKAAKARRSG